MNVAHILGMTHTHVTRVTCENLDQSELGIQYPHTCHVGVIMGAHRGGYKMPRG